MTSLHLTPRALDLRPDVHAEICSLGLHLRAATRWRTTCRQCRESIPSGNVGPATADWDVEAGQCCNAGLPQHQHRCGAVNTPSEIIRELPADLDPDDIPGMDDLELAYALDPLDVEILAALDRVVTQDVRGERQRIAWRLTAELGDALSGACDPDGSDTQPGVREMSGGWEAWDYVPDQSGQIITVSVTRRA
jgi:hypothetical protein